MARIRRDRLLIAAASAAVHGAILAVQGARLASPSLPADSAQGWQRAIVSQAADAILVADPAGTIGLWNRGAERIFGIPAAKAIGQSLDLVIPEMDR